MAISRAQYEKKNRYSGQIRNSYDYWRTNGKHLFSRQVAVLIIAQVGRKSRMIWHSCFNLLTPIHLHVPFSSTFPCVSFFFLFHHSFNRRKLITNCEIDTYVEKWLLFDTEHIFSIRNRPISLACSHQISTKKWTDFETMLRKFVGYNGIRLT